MKKILLAVIVLAVALAGWMLSRSSGDVAVNTPAVSPTPTPLVSPESTASPSPVASKNIIIYTNSGYSPATLTIKKGETVTWKNQSNGGMWTASNPHPVHNGYPINNGCINSVFDECKADPSGTEWSFTFTLSGTWGYHNHRNPNHTGTIIVQ